MTETDKLRAKGYTIHDGGPCPFSESTAPGCVMVDGTIILPGTVTANRIDWTQVRAHKVRPGNVMAGIGRGGERARMLHQRTMKRLP